MAGIHVNYLAIITVGVFAYILGTLWYSRFLFGRQWRSAVGTTENEFRMTIKPGIFVITFVSWLIAAYVLAVVVHYSKASGFMYGVIVGFLCWFGFVACLSLFQMLFARRPLILWVINSGYAFFALLIGGGILAVWK